MAADDKAVKQPKESPKAVETPTPSLPSVADTKKPETKAAAATSAATEGVMRQTTNLRCPHCNRLSEWDDPFLAANHGARVACPLCNETMALP